MFNSFTNIDTKIKIAQTTPLKYLNCAVTSSNMANKNIGSKNKKEIIKNIPLCFLSFFMKKIGVNIDNNNIFFSVK